MLQRIQDVKSNNKMTHFASVLNSNKAFHQVVKKEDIDIQEGQES